MNGIGATAQITTAHPRTRVLILTTFDLDEDAFEGLRAGASGFLLKGRTTGRPGSTSAADRHTDRWICRLTCGDAAGA